MSNKVRQLENGGMAFKCPGCKEKHVIYVGDGAGPRWSWNGSLTQPTFQPSVLVRSGHFVPERGGDKDCWCTYNAEHPDDPADFKCRHCHTFITDGRIQFLSDCSHELAGQTVDLPEWEHHV